METLHGYLTLHGQPVALYSDKHSIFRVNHPDHEGELMPFTRPLRTPPTRTAPYCTTHKSSI